MADDTKEVKKPPTVLMAYAPGPVVRIIGDIEWSEAAGWVHPVPLDVAADMIAYPHEGWSLGEKLSPATRKALADRLGVDPKNVPDGGEAIRRPKSLADIMGAERAEQFVSLGVGDVPALAGLKGREEEIGELVFRSGATAAEIKLWIERAAEEVV